MDAAGWTNVIAILALIISIISAVFSWRSTGESKMANRLSIHAYQKELHQSFLEVFRYLYANGQLSESNMFVKFGPHVKTASLYVSASLAKKISEFYDLCLEIEDLRWQVYYAQDELRMLDAQSVGVPADDRFTLMQRNASKSKLHECIAVQSAGVRKAIECGSQIDKDFVGEIKVS